MAMFSKPSIAVIASLDVFHWFLLCDEEEPYRMRVYHAAALVFVLALQEEFYVCPRLHSCRVFRAMLREH
jgi:hypothetical protein